MQRKQKCEIETRTFPQIWDSLSQDERDDLTLRLYAAKCCRTRQSIWEWASGKGQPGAMLVRDTVAKTVSKFIGRKSTPQTLFP